MDAQDRVRGGTQEADCPTAEQRPAGGSGAREKFAEPRGWAMKWDGFGLSESGARKREIKDSNGSGIREKFMEPRGWAMKWDGGSLSEVGEPGNRHTPVSAVESR
ncbi:MAG: hypothetical protein SWK90_12765 [Chloroflexota bacterium]|nr:hypothetical protein [Chloroflexota bacterium]